MCPKASVRHGVAVNSNSIIKEIRRHCSHAQLTAKHLAHGNDCQPEQLRIDRAEPNRSLLLTGYLLPRKISGSLGSSGAISSAAATELRALSSKNRRRPLSASQRASWASSMARRRRASARRSEMGSGIGLAPIRSFQWPYLSMSCPEPALGYAALSTLPPGLPIVFPAGVAGKILCKKWLISLGSVCTAAILSRRCPLWVKSGHRISAR
jgi:hypothetical protein